MRIERAGPAGAARVVLALAAWLSPPAWALARAPAPPDTAEALFVDPGSSELVTRPELRARLASSPLAYFRFVNARFLALVCERYAPLLERTERVTVHGDAHLEQYAVTDRGRGLTDFDDSTSGPAFLDLARFATSIRLALDERGWTGGEALIGSFLGGYREALLEPTRQAPEPSVVQRLRAGFERDRAACLARAESLMEAMPPGAAPSDATLHRAAQLLAAASGWPEAYFHVKRVGTLKIGIGSATTEKYLMRIEGPSPGPGDDVILEVKEVRPLPSLGCLQTQPGATRILVAQSRLAYEPFDYVGGLTLEGHSYWFHAWPDNYTELDVRRSVQGVEDLREVAFDVGVQLGRGHAKEGSKRRAAALRRALLRDLQRADLDRVSAELFEATRTAWRRFSALRGSPPPP